MEIENIFNTYSEYPEYTEEDRIKETEMFNNCCGSCLNFNNYLASAGFCKISKLNVCDPKAMIDMFDNKCNNWIIKKYGNNNE